MVPSEEEGQGVGIESELPGLNFKFQCSGHLGSVTRINYLESINTLASSSEDCTIKLWDLGLLSHRDRIGNNNIVSDAYYTL